MVRSSSSSWAQVATRSLPYLAAWCASAWAGFGVPGFIAVCTFAMFQLGTKERWSSESSAYSVFNAGGTRIAGTLTAEQIDGQLRNGGHAVRDAPAEPAGHWWGRGSKVNAASTPAAQQLTEAEIRQRRAAAADAAQARLNQEQAAEPDG